MITIVTPTIRPAGLDNIAQGLKQQSFTDFEWLIEANLSNHNDFNEAMNKMIRRAKGDVIVSIQDYITPAPDALKKIWEYSNTYPNRFVTCSVRNGDWRDVGTEREVDWQEWEIDFGFAATQALKEIGGFDQELDELTWGFDNVNTGYRAHLAGYTMWCTPEIAAHSFPHERDSFRDRRNADLHNARLQQFTMGLKLPPMV